MLIFTVAARELRSMFLSPLAWSILAVVQLITCFMFFFLIENFQNEQPRTAGQVGVTDFVIAPLLGNTAIVLLLVAPLLTMRLISEERRNKTMSLLFSAPLSMTQIVLGKYFGLLGFLLIMLGMITLMPLALLFGSNIDMGQLASGLLGLALLLASFAAVGLFMSTLTSQPTVAAISTFGILLLLWILDWGSATQANQTGNLFAYLSLVNHYEALLRGVFRSSDVIYYLLFILTFLTLAIRRLDADRLQH